MCFSYCVMVLSPSFLEELYELFLESCLPRICLLVSSDGPLAPGAAWRHILWSLGCHLLLLKT